MLGLIGQRLLFSLITLFIVATLVFVATELLPGDVATAYLGREATEQRLAELRAELGLDRPPLERFLTWMGGAIRGDLGLSLARQQPISDVLGFRLRNTLALGVLAGLVGIPLALILGVIAGLTRDQQSDIWISSISLVGMTLPEFVIGTLLIFFFSIKLTLFPAVTIYTTGDPIQKMLPSMVLPIATLTIVMAAYILRMVRTSVIDVMTSDYVQMATLKGVRRSMVVMRHALPNALLPTINATALTVAWLVGGLVIIETVFNFPGIGTLMIEAINDRDIPLLQSIALVGAGIYVIVNLAADLLTMVLNPRLRTLRGA